jgi:hypothetical protein
MSSVQLGDLTDLAFTGDLSELGWKGDYKYDDLEVVAFRALPTPGPAQSPQRPLNG